MTILDELLKKKDVLAYINFRILFLKKERNEYMTTLSKKDRKFIKERFNDKIFELEELKNIIKSGSLKTESKIYSYKVGNLLYLE